MQEAQEEEPVLGPSCQACGRRGKPYITAHDSLLDGAGDVDWTFCRHCAVAFVTRRLPAGAVIKMRKDAGGHTEATKIGYYNKKGQVQTPMLVAKESGWLDPEGKFHPCEYGFHEKWAERNGLSSRSMEKKGWLRLRWGEWTKGTKRPSQAQLDAMWDWCQSSKVGMPRWAKEERDEQE